jgi:hypothetical protein
MGFVWRLQINDILAKKLNTGSARKEYGIFNEKFKQFKGTDSKANPNPGSEPSI